MDLKALDNIPPWDWPANTAETLVSVLRDKQAAESDRVPGYRDGGRFHRGQRGIG